MQGPNAPAGWDLAAGVFTTALGRTMSFLTPLLGETPSVVDLRVDVVTEGPIGATRLEFRDNAELIFSGVRKVDKGVVTKQAMENRGLRFVIALNRSQRAGTGQVLETLCHEYGGHACPWGDHLMTLRRPLDPSIVPLLEGALARAMDGDLMGGMQHLAMAEGHATYFEGLAAAISSVLETASTQILRDFTNEKTVDIQRLQGTTQPLGNLLLASSQIIDSDSE